LSLLPVAVGLALTAAIPAQAQLRWDAAAEAGLSKRFTTGGAAGAPSPDFGPVVELQAHVALVPMVRLGLYLAEDLSPVPDRLRSFSSGGLHVRFTPPLLAAPWRTWLFTGFGFAYGYDAGEHTSGQLFEIPAGAGVGARVAKHAMVFAELGARFGLGFYGRMYEAAPAETAAGAGSGGASPAFLGHDAVALGLTVGLSLEE
jgi:hypothetical protein